jgi:hypothetical protein
MFYPESMRGTGKAYRYQARSLVHYQFFINKTGMAKLHNYITASVGSEQEINSLSIL